MAGTRDELGRPDGGSRTPPLLAVRDLRVSFPNQRGGWVTPVDGISFELFAGRALSLVGESGSGKSLTALSILKLVRPPGRITSGEILYAGRDVLRAPRDELRQIRGNRIAMVFQEPMTALNPLFTVGEQIAETLRAHEGATRRQSQIRAVEMLRLVEIPEPEHRAGQYPHELSGGMRQRVMIAMALSCRPQILIADEPTTALDVTVQAQILDLLAELRERLRMSLLLVTHDLALVAERAEDLVVLYAGRVAESGPVEAVLARPLHPYTRALLRCVPGAGPAGRRLETIPGTVPDPRDFPAGCRFRTRCPDALATCAEEAPELRELGPGHRAACLRAGEWA